MTAAQRRGLQHEVSMPSHAHDGRSSYVTSNPVGGGGRAFGSLRTSTSNPRPARPFTKTNSPPQDFSSHHQSTEDTHQWRSPLQPSQPEPSEQVTPPTRTRSRLRKRPSQRKTNSKAMSRSLGEDALTALPQLPNSATIPKRSSSLHKERPASSGVAGAERPRTAKHKPSRTSLGSTEDNKSWKHFTSVRSNRPMTSTAADNNTNRELPLRTSSPPTFTSPVLSPTSGGQRTPRHVALAPNDPSPLNPVYYKPSPPLTRPDFGNSYRHQPMSASDKVAPGSRHATQMLPEGVQIHPNFKPGTTTHDTDVTETFHPAVTHEVIKEHTVEIIREEITREIHVHHYYTQIQPVRVLEVLPARHFLVDPETGHKREIPEPAGWTMPTNMQPKSPDTSVLVPISRHYLVNEQYPKGVLEPPPRNLRGKNSQELGSLAGASHKAMWSPFPKTTQKGNRPMSSRN